MTTTDEESEDDPVDEEAIETLAVSSAYKVLGEFSDPSGAGVLGQNNASSGTPIGVEGSVPNANDGYGLYTVDDAGIEGVLDTAETDFVVEAGTTSTADARNVVLGHAINDVLDGAVGAAIAGGGFNNGTNAIPNRVYDDYGTVGGGANNRAGSNDGDQTSARYAAVGGGLGNSASGPQSTVSGGQVNTASADDAVVGGGRNNVANGVRGTIGGGYNNAASGNSATVGGGRQNEATATFSTIAGGGPTDTSSPSTTNNVVYDDYGTIGGGGNNQAGSEGTDPSATFTTVGGGESNTASADFATVGGGDSNTASNFRATVSGGLSNTASGGRATVGGGYNNEASGALSTVGGGQINEASGGNSTVGGGRDNTASGFRSTVPGGGSNTADGDNSFAAGRLADTNGFSGTVVFGDSTTDTVTADALDQFVVQAGGGVKFYTDSDTTTNTGAELPSGSGSWSSLSARASKANVEPVDSAEALEGVRSLDITTWNYRSQGEGVRHLGPMAEDFHEAFELGEDPERISTVDADGVSLAAIQGLADRLDERDERTGELAAENRELRERLADLETRLDEVESTPATADD